MLTPSGFSTVEKPDGVARKRGRVDDAQHPACACMRGRAKRGGAGRGHGIMHASIKSVNKSQNSTPRSPAPRRQRGDIDGDCADGRRSWWVPWVGGAGFMKGEKAFKRQEGVLMGGSGGRRAAGAQGCITLDGRPPAFRSRPRGEWWKGGEKNYARKTEFAKGGLFGARRAGSKGKRGCTEDAGVGCLHIAPAGRRGALGRPDKRGSR